MKLLSLSIVSLLAASSLSLGCSANVEEADPPAAEGEEAFTVAERLGLPYGGELTVEVAPFYTAAYGGLVKKDNPSACQVTNYGICQLKACTGNATGASGDGDAGDIVVTGGPAPVTLTPDATGTYDFFGFEEPAAFRPGDVLSFAAAGGSGARGFTVSGLRIPTSVQTSLPLEPTGRQTAPISLDTTRDFSLTWQTEGASLVEVSLSAREGTYTPIAPGQVSFDVTKSTWLRCLFPAKLGRGTLPAAALRAFPKGTTTPPTPGVVQTGVLQNSLEVIPQNRKVVVVRRPAGGTRVVDVIARQREIKAIAQELTLR
jgi:hypothetical protein